MVDFHCYVSLPEGRCVLGVETSKDGSSGSSAFVRFASEDEVGFTFLVLESWKRLANRTYFIYGKYVHVIYDSHVHLVCRSFLGSSFVWTVLSLEE